jgi:hypothetical protein
MGGTVMIADVAVALAWFFAFTICVVGITWLRFHP